MSSTPHLVVCGEGATDFGDEGAPGPLALLVWRSLEHLAQQRGQEYRHPETKFCRGSQFSDQRRKNTAQAIGRQMRIAPKGCDALRQKAENFATRELAPDDLGLFHSDVDFTRQQKPQECYTKIREAIQKGLSAAGKGNQACAVVPLPRTEAWLLRLAPEYKGTPHDIETMPGNDSAPNSLKKILKELGYVSQHQKKQGGCSLNDLVERCFCYDKLMCLNSFHDFMDALSKLPWTSLLT